MDNVAHTLAGLALAEAGLKRRTALGTATLAIGANLPDVDALVYVVGSGVDALVARRGWTHGVLAMAVLPLLLAAAMRVWDRRVRRRRGPPRVPAHGGWLLALACIGVWSHPLLDLLNTYGVRLLMPFSERWFYGDTLFIVDPWLWLTLGAGVAISRVRERRMRSEGRRPGLLGDQATRPARVAIGLLAAYVVAMAVSARMARDVVRSQLADAERARVMVAPVPAIPFRRSVVSDLGGTYEIGRLRWEPGVRYAPDTVLPSGREEPAALAAARTRDGAAFLTWARFPRFTSEAMGDSVRVRISDLRYADARGRGWASVEVTVPAAAAAR